ncbi:prepilin-type N-terminal cleavage/methylation domain-containing protein [Geminisphaera colitermitum]|uniref:prepilin-type N-terminal cleavage/methylation domain-containing protein n=1 Tax=Geminisphaera colitermitum TaxID=1148786 RepID=UPI000158C670|nr:prepilin-type N-terminal cleavage/methylation domain-containing protein [Geminisphaera colitermitum]
MPQATNTRSAPGFTLLELLVVIAIIGILSGIVISVLGPVRRRVEQTQCTVRLRELWVATTLYRDETKGFYMGYGSAKRWYQYLEPYLGDITKSKTPLLICPSVSKRFAADTGKDALAHYWPNYSYNFYFGDSSSTGMAGAPPANELRVISPSQKMLFMDGGYNTSSPAETINGTAYKDYHNGGNNILFADGHIKLWKNSKNVGEQPYLAGGAKDMWRPYYPVN